MMTRFILISPLPSLITYEGDTALGGARGIKLRQEPTSSGPARRHGSTSRRSEPGAPHERVAVKRATSGPSSARLSRSSCSPRWAVRRFRSASNRRKGCRQARTPGAQAAHRIDRRGDTSKDRRRVIATTRRHHSGRSLPPTSSRLSSRPPSAPRHFPRESLIGSTRLMERPGRRSSQ